MGLNSVPNFGHLVMFGLGGIYVEALKHVVFRISPLTDRDAQEMVEAIRGYPILKGIRDGTELAFPARGTSGPVIEIVSVSTGESRKLPLPGWEGNERHNLAWSPDGRFFAYVDTDNTTSEVTRLWILSASDQ